MRVLFSFINRLFEKHVVGHKNVVISLGINLQRKYFWMSEKSHGQNGSLHGLGTFRNAVPEICILSWVHFVYNSFLITKKQSFFNC